MSKVLYRVEVDGRGCRAICSCGWVSQRGTNGGLVGALWDAHLTEVHAGSVTVTEVDLRDAGTAGETSEPSTAAT